MANKNNLAVDLAFVKSHMSFLPTAVMSLEKADLPLNDALAILKNLQDKINSIPGEKGTVIQDKMKAVLLRNPGLSALQDVGRSLSGNADALPEGIGSAAVANLKYCPIASIDVERIFSLYKAILSDWHQSFTKDNLSKVMVTHCFYNRLSTG